MFDDVTVLRIRTPPPDIEFGDEDELKMDMINRKVRAAMCRLICMGGLVIVMVGVLSTLK